MKGRRDSRAGHDRSPERRNTTKEPSPNKFRLPRQSTAIDESCLPPGVWGRRGSQPTALSPDPEDGSGRKARRDSLSPDSASYSRGRRDSRSHLSPERSNERDVSPVGRSRRGRLRRQSTSIAGHRRGSHSPRSPDSSSTCSSRDASPCNKPAVASTPHDRPAIRRQSTTEEILIARGFRRQSTTEEMIRCRNFRRQSSQSDDCCRYRGRRDSSAQITDGTLATMTVETTSTFFDSSTQTGKCSLDNSLQQISAIKLIILNIIPIKKTLRSRSASAAKKLVNVTCSFQPLNTLYFNRKKSSSNFKTNHFWVFWDEWIVFRDLSRQKAVK